MISLSLKRQPNPAKTYFQDLNVLGDWEEQINYNLPKSLPIPIALELPTFYQN